MQETSCMTGQGFLDNGNTLHFGVPNKKLKKLQSNAAKAILGIKRNDSST